MPHCIFKFDQEAFLLKSTNENIPVGGREGLGVGWGAANLPGVKARDGSSSDPNCPYLCGRVYVTSAGLRRLDTMSVHSGTTHKGLGCKAHELLGPMTPVKSFYFLLRQAICISTRHCRLSIRGVFTHMSSLHPVIPRLGRAVS